MAVIHWQLSGDPLVWWGENQKKQATNALMALMPKPPQVVFGATQLAAFYFFLAMWRSWGAFLILFLPCNVHKGDLATSLVNFFCLQCCCFFLGGNKIAIHLWINNNDAAATTSCFVAAGWLLPPMTWRSWGAGWLFVNFVFTLQCVQGWFGIFSLIYFCLMLLFFPGGKA